MSEKRGEGKYIYIYGNMGNMGNMEKENWREIRIVSSIRVNLFRMNRGEMRGGGIKKMAAGGYASPPPCHTRQSKPTDAFRNQPARWLSCAAMIATIRLGFGVNIWYFPCCNNLPSVVSCFCVIVPLSVSVAGRNGPEEWARRHQSEPLCKWSAPIEHRGGGVAVELCKLSPWEMMMRSCPIGAWEWPPIASSLVSSVAIKGQIDFLLRHRAVTAWNP